MVSIRQLRYFDALASEGHFGRAAQRMNITQPALSMQIAQFEMTLGVALAERGARGVNLTPFGQEVAERARQILLSIKDLEAFAGHSGKLLSGALNLGVIPSIAPYLLPIVLPSVRVNFPDLILKLKESQTQNLITDLSDGSIDLALLALPADASGLEEMHLFDDPFYLAAPKQHQLMQNDFVAAADAVGEAILLLEDGHCLRNQTISFCQSVGISKFDTFGATSLATITQMVANGYGVTLLPKISIRQEIGRMPALSVRPFEPPAPYRSVGLVWRESSPRKLDFAEFGREVIDSVAGMFVTEPGA